MEQPTEEQIKETAKQLRKPEGEAGIEMAEIMNQGNFPMNMHTLAVVNPQENDDILEIGMGNGFFVKYILRHSPSINYTGCDYSKTMVQKAIADNTIFLKKGRASFLEGNVHELPFTEIQFTKIFTVNTFYFWEDAELALSEIKRVLHPEGAFILSVRPKSLMSQYPVTKYDFTLWEDEEIEALLRKHFSKIEITKIQEPDQEWMGEIRSRACIIFNCKL